MKETYLAQKLSVHMFVVGQQRKNGLQYAQLDLGSLSECFIQREQEIGDK